ncbi:MAG: DUF1957 domain-containing protein [Treponema sp.]|nr:DUF1957 domain-containing protein [Treponema sp.]
MEFRYAISLVLEAHLPYVKEYKKEDDLSIIGEEERFYEYISETLLPLLEVLFRLDSDHVPFKLAMALSPILCHMLCDEHFQKKYLSYLDKQIEFGKQELERTSMQSQLNKLAQNYYDTITEKRNLFTEKYEKNLLKTFDFYRRKGKLEILATCATHAFLPFISHNAEALQAQMEIPVAVYRKHFAGNPQGFWLPEHGWTHILEPYLKAYNYSYTILDSHGLLFGDPAPEKGCFFPVKTPNGTFILARDHYAVTEIEKMAADEIYRSNDHDAGYDLPSETVKPFSGAAGERHRTGYGYYTRVNSVYDQKAASDKVKEHAQKFIQNTVARLEEASKHMKEAPISLYTQKCGFFGCAWHEGPEFIETLFRKAAECDGLNFVSPSEYIYMKDAQSYQVVAPEFSSCGENGYAETWLDVSNDWIYRHLYQSMDRMTELAERFPDDTGLKERALNQAAREILLAQSSDWPSLLYRQESTEFAHNQAENALRNFTTIYEALGSNYISTEWLTNLEKRHNIFPNINYRVFRRKK